MTFAFCRQETPQEDAEEEASKASEEDSLGTEAEVALPVVCLPVMR
ncbi:MAG TPA: hypothetical protein VKK30_02485 [Actinomycetota bacterium]|nr:hypothetical protein [Actinomycetota bacterium]